MSDEQMHQEVLRPVSMHYCPGCGHTTLHRILAEALDHLDLGARAVGVCGVGCSFMMYDYLDVDFASAPPGRAPSVATGLKRARPDSLVFTYQGDNDAMGVGLGDLLHTVARNEPLACFVVNNAASGLSGGQLSAASPMGQLTRTTPQGRSEKDGHPMRLVELATVVGAAARIERVALDGADAPARVRASVEATLKYALEGRGLALLEILSACPTWWDVAPERGSGYVKDVLVPAFPPRAPGPAKGGS